jgi:uncharacterized protein
MVGDHASLHKLRQLILADPLRMQALVAVKQLKLPDCWIAAGFIRNLAWDFCQQKNTTLNDIDVIYFCTENVDEYADYQLQQTLEVKCSGLPWSVKNQARMHLKNGDKPYQSSLDAMSYWPEKQTAVALRLNQLDQLEIISCFGLKHLFSRKISHNPKRDKLIFEQRIKQKRWLEKWPLLSIEWCF